MQDSYYPVPFKHREHCFRYLTVNKSPLRLLFPKLKNLCSFVLVFHMPCFLDHLHSFKWTLSSLPALGTSEMFMTMIYMFC